MKGDVQEILAGNLNCDELGVPVALLIEIIVFVDREHPRISPDSNTRPAMPELFVQVDGESRTTDLAISPVMFRAHPIGFAIAILLIPLLIGIMLLLFWWLTPEPRGSKSIYIPSDMKPASSARVGESSAAGRSELSEFSNRC